MKPLAFWGLILVLFALQFFTTLCTATTTPLSPSTTTSTLALPNIIASTNFNIIEDQIIKITRSFAYSSTSPFAFLTYRFEALTPSFGQSVSILKADFETNFESPVDNFDFRVGSWSCSDHESRIQQAHTARCGSSCWREMGITLSDKRDIGFLFQFFDHSLFQKKNTDTIAEYVQTTIKFEFSVRSNGNAKTTKSLDDIIAFEDAITWDPLTYPNSPFTTPTDQTSTRTPNHIISNRKPFDLAANPDGPADGRMFYDQFPYKHNLFFPTLSLEMLPQWNYTVGRELYESTNQFPQDHYFRLMMNVMHPIKHGKDTVYFFTILQHSGYEIDTSLYDPVELRMNKDIPNKNPLTSLYSIYYDPSQRRSFQQQQLMESTTQPFCVLNTLIPFPVTIHSTIQFSIQFDHWDARFHDYYNREAMKLMSFVCYNMFVKVLTPSYFPFSGNYNLQSRPFQIMVHHVVTLGGPAELFVTNEILSSSPFSFTNYGDIASSSTQLIQVENVDSVDNVDSVEKQTKLDEVDDDLHRERNPVLGDDEDADYEVKGLGWPPSLKGQLYSPYPQSYLTPSQLECAPQLGFNGDKFIRCLVSDDFGHMITNLSEVIFYFYQFTNTTTAQRVVEKDKVWLSIRQLNPIYGKQQVWAELDPTGYGPPASILSKRSKIVPVFYTSIECQLFSKSDTLLVHSCFDPMNMNLYPSFDPSLPLIVDFFAPSETQEYPLHVSQISDVSLYPRLMVGYSSAQSGHRTTPIWYPIQYYPTYTTTTTGGIIWANLTDPTKISGDKDAVIKQVAIPYHPIAWAFKLKGAQSLVLPHYLSFNITKFEVPLSDSHFLTLTVESITLFFPSRNFRFKTSTPAVCYYHSNYQPDTPATYQFAQFPDYISANVTQAVPFEPGEEHSDVADTSYADVLILGKYKQSTQLSVNKAILTLFCDVEIELNPVYHPAQDEGLETTGFVSLILHTESLTPSGPLSSAEGLGDDRLQIRSQSIQQFTMSTPSVPKSGFPKSYIFLIVLGVTVFVMLVAVLIVFFFPNISTWCTALFKRCCPGCFKYERKRQSKTEPLLPSSKTVPSSSLTKYPKDVQKQILKRAAIAKALSLTAKNAVDLESNVENKKEKTTSQQRTQPPTPHQSINQHHHILAEIQAREVEYTTRTGQKSFKKQPEAQRRRDQEVIQAVLTNTIPHSTRLVTEYDGSGKLKKRRTVYQ